MADVPAGVKYGRVTAHLTSMIADTNDAGNLPDEANLAGTITLSPLVKVVRWPTLTPARISAVQPAICPIIGGDLCAPGTTTPGVWVLATDQDLSEPDTIQWQAQFNITGVSQQPATVVFDVPNGTTIDLASVLSTVVVPPVITVVSAGGVEAAVDTYLAANPPSGGSGLPGRDSGDTGKFLELVGTVPTWLDLNDHSVITTIQANNTALAALVNTRVPAGSSGVNGFYLKWDNTAGAGVWTAVTGGGISSVASTDITDSTAVGRALLTAANAAAGRAAISAGTSDLVIGTTSSTAKAGNYAPIASDISNSTAVGRALITAADAAAARTAISAGTSNLAIGTTSTTAKAGNYAPAIADISDATTIGKTVLGAANAAGVRSAISAPDAAATILTTGAQSKAGVLTFTTDPVFNDNAIPQAKVVGLTALATPGNYYVIDYNPTTGWPLRNAVYGTLPGNAVVLWRGPAATPPPDGGGYANAGDDFQLVP